MPSLFWFDPFLEARAGIRKKFRSFFGSRKFAFKINWPLVKANLLPEWSDYQINAYVLDLMHTCGPNIMRSNTFFCSVWILIHTFKFFYYRLHCYSYIIDLHKDFICQPINQAMSNTKIQAIHTCDPLTIWHLHVIQ